VLAALAASAVSAFLIRWGPSRHYLMELMHRLSGS